MAEAEEEKKEKKVKQEEANNSDQNKQETEVDEFFDTELEEIKGPVHQDRKKNDFGNMSLELLSDLELSVSVELARKEMTIQDVLQLGEDSIVEFDKVAGENVDLLVNDKKIAEGEVVVVDDRFGIRITNLLNPNDRLKGLTS